MTAVVPSWINKGQAKSAWPEWLIAVAIGRPEANGSFMIRSRHGQARVHRGAMAFRYGEHVYTCAPGEAREMVADLRRADELVPPKPSNAAQVGSLEADVADRADDTDDISARIRAQGEITRKPQKSPASAPVPPAKEIGSRQAANAGKSRNLPAKGSMPSIEWVQLDRLKVDDAYQRSIETGPSRALIARIGREWDWRLCVPLMVSRRADGLFVIDGQHRLQGARKRNDVPQLPCCISVYDGPEAEAAMFVAANRERRAMNRLDDFHAAQAGGDEDAIAVAAVITSVGFTVSRKTGSAAWVPGEVAFTSAIARVRRKHGDMLVRQALQMMADAFPDQRLTAGSSVFTAVCAVLVSPPADFDPDRLFRALLTFDMPGWASFLAGAKGGDDRAAKLRDVLLVAYADAKPEQAA